MDATRNRAVKRKAPRSKSRVRSHGHGNNRPRPNRKPAADVDISYIVSCYDRPGDLIVCLGSLLRQTHRRFEVIVTDNGAPEFFKEHKRIIRFFNDPRVSHFATGKLEVSDCYWSAEYGAARAKGRYLCFPCDDCYYPPEWAIRMLQTAVESQADLIYNEFVLMGPESAGGSGVYQRWRPTPRRLVKSQFLIRAEIFPGFSGKPKASVSASADQVIGQELIRSGATFACARGLEAVHN